MYLFIFLVWFAFHTALIANEPEIVNKITGVLKSSIHWPEILKQGKQEVQKQATHTFLVQFLLNVTDLMITM